MYHFLPRKYILYLQRNVLNLYRGLDKFYRLYIASSPFLHQKLNRVSSLRADSAEECNLIAESVSKRCLKKAACAFSLVAT